MCPKFVYRPGAVPGTRRTDFYRIADGKLAEEWIALGIPVGE